MVIANGSSWVMPSRTWVENSAGLHRLRPTWISTAARQASGIWLSTGPAKTTATSRSPPWISAESRSRAPAATLAPLRTMTAVTGSPPSSPDTELAAPWASSSRSGGLRRLSGSSRSTACTDSSVSMLATMAMVIAAIHTSGRAAAAKSGRGSAAARPADAAQRHLDVVAGPRASPDAAQHFGQQAGGGHRDQRRRNQLVLRQRRVLPAVEQRQRQRRDERPRLGGAGRGVSVEAAAGDTEGHRQLLPDDGDADGGEHPLDDRRRAPAR